jgi:hypothetical protein
MARFDWPAAPAASRTVFCGASAKMALKVADGQQTISLSFASPRYVVFITTN